jgi:hypothetical protein
MQDLGWELDYSEASVQTLENMITAQFGDWRPWRRGKPAKKNRPIASLVGAYLGEVMILHIGGSWGWMPEFDVAAVQLPAGGLDLAAGKGAEALRQRQGGRPCRLLRRYEVGRSQAVFCGLTAYRLRVEHDRDWAVVGELHGHAGAEDACRDWHPERAKVVAEALVERLRLLGLGGTAEARAVALGGVRDQRELADDDRCGAEVEERAVEAALLILEDPQARDAAREPCRLLLPIRPRDPEQDAEARPDLSNDVGVHDHPRRRDALDDGPHR